MWVKGKTIAARKTIISLMKHCCRKYNLHLYISPLSDPTQYDQWLLASLIGEDGNRTLLSVLRVPSNENTRVSLVLMDTKSASPSLIKSLSAYAENNGVKFYLLKNSTAVEQEQNNAEETSGVI